MTKILRRIAQLVLPEPVVVQFRRWRLWRQLIARARRDCRRYLDHSGSVLPYARKQSHQASLTAHYHVLEKALSFPAPRPGFGQEAAQHLLRELDAYVRRFGPDDLAARVVNVLTAYEEFNRQHGFENLDFATELQILKKRVQCTGKDTRGGVLPISCAEIQKAGRSPFSEFVKGRYSIRNFARKAVPTELIQRAVEISLKTPSACNRQPWKVHLYQDHEDCLRLLQYQHGNRGFGDSAGAVLIVTCDLSGFFTVEELYAAFVDGGMFAMSLVYAIHSLGLGACCLNVSFTRHDENALRRAGGIPENEVLILMVLVGHLPEQFMVAQSCRRPVSEVLIQHQKSHLGTHAGAVPPDGRKCLSVPPSGEPAELPPCALPAADTSKCQS